MVGGNALEEDLRLCRINAGIRPLGPRFQGNLICIQPIHILDLLPAQLNEVPSAFLESEGHSWIEISREVIVAK